MYNSHKYFVLIFFVFILGQFAAAQKTNTNSNDLDSLKSAYIDFKNSNYHKAYPYFQKMYVQYPKDPAYNYYTGVCLLFLDKNPEKALKRLRIAATKDVPNDVYFYLGIAYHKSYLFNDALKNFDRFKEKATKSMFRDYDLLNHINSVNNAIYHTKSGTEPIVYSKENVSEKGFYSLYKFLGFEGSFGKNQDLLKFPMDSLSSKSLMYIPNKLERNEVVYFSLKNEKRGDLDIFRSTRKNDGTWSEPENLGELINSPFDECYPYIHTDGSTLFFASKGQYSMGGYDIYKSIWNWEKQQWSAPENLGFPINSPFDDFLYVPSPDEKFAYFTSNRDYSAKEVTVYKIKYLNYKKIKENSSLGEIMQLSQLNVNEIIEKDTKSEKSVKVKNELSEIVKLQAKESFLYKSEYDSLLNQTMKWQLKADSLQWIIDSKRMLLEKSQYEQDIKNLTNELVNLEEKIYLAQKNAEKSYERVREIEQLNLAQKNVSYENTQEKKSTTTVNQSTQKNELSDINQGGIDSIGFKKLEKFDSDNHQFEEIKDLGFYLKSPSIYNEKNPIPVNEKLPRGVIYMIQLGAFSTPKKPSAFYGFTPLTSIKKEGSTLTKYFTGKFLKLKEAESSLNDVKQRGYKDAYVVAFKDGKIVPINEAVKSESKKSTAVQNKQINLKDNEDDLVIKYVLKIELNKSDSVLISKINSQVPDNKIAIKELKGDIIFYRIESFTSFEESYSLKNKLEAIINKEVEIHAFFADSRIPVDQARKMTQ